MPRVNTLGNSSVFTVTLSHQARSCPSLDSIADRLMPCADLGCACAVGGNGVRGVSDRPRGVKEGAGVLVALVRVSAEVVALGLDEIARQAVTAVAVVVGKARA